MSAAVDLRRRRHTERQEETSPPSALQHCHLLDSRGDTSLPDWALALPGSHTSDSEGEYQGCCPHGTLKLSDKARSENHSGVTAR
ncbi:hypothetical protein AAFF_G00190860 [Aldrovandia affinis]|uniref:Uncharacterized protein n=1 Tax=Aldrovandia affinis TaxID=143900 RepID=A0AAD7RK00_9TELE|nr:hypothetical protein AAFF_G00190860 [Aldrovandia affinis]